MNFLQPSINDIRKSIRDIDDSYNNDWDILAELLQNAVDAVNQSERDGKISLEVNSRNKTISISDNGIGIDKDVLPEILKPFSSRKDEDESTIGEKGVGLTFVIFQSNYFEIQTKSESGSAVGILEGSRSWKSLTDESQLDLILKQSDEPFTGTRIVLKKLGDLPIFNWSFEQLKFVVRTKTAIGNTISLFEKVNKIDVEITHIDSGGATQKTNLSFKYFLLSELVKPISIITIEDFIKYASNSEITDRQKRLKLQNKVITDSGTFLVPAGNRNVYYYALFVPKRMVWDEFTIKQSLATQENLDDDEWVEKYGYTTFQSGITLSVKGMPTGIFITRPDTGYAGYWSNLFLLFEDREIKFDIGRKSIHGRTAERFRAYAKDIFNKYLRYVTKYVSGAVPSGETQWNRDEMFSDISSLIDLNIPGIKLKKSPKDQEASVAGLFFECLGNGKITDITPLISGYRSRYDLYAKWGNRNVVIEFKSKLSLILKDFSDEQKLFDEVDCVVCWDVDENDKQKFKNKAISLLEIQESLPGTGTVEFPHSTHKLELANVNPVYVIDMKKLLTTAK